MKNDLLNNIAAITDKKEKYVKLYYNSYHLKPIKQLLKTFKKKDIWECKITSVPDLQCDLVISWQSGKSSGSMTFFGYN